ncbi:MAG: hypothetical protein IIC73_06190 [Armatimonadetes bacterium]|nr:hypothetical protein [Armatimonadota bacterium]
MQINDRDITNEQFVDMFEFSWSQWLAVARTLYHASEIMEQRYTNAVERSRNLSKSHKKGHVSNSEFAKKLARPDKSEELNRVAEMLRAMAFECELKGYVYRARVEKAGHTLKVKPIKSHHNFEALVKELKIKVSKDQLQNLKWQAIMLQMGRYPVGWLPVEEDAHPKSSQERKKRKKPRQLGFSTAPSIAHTLYESIKQQLPEGWVPDDFRRISRKYREE